MNHILYFCILFRVVLDSANDDRALARHQVSDGGVAAGEHEARAAGALRDSRLGAPQRARREREPRGPIDPRAPRRPPLADSRHLYAPSHSGSGSLGVHT